MAQEYNANIGRALGWDLAYFGWDPREDAPDDVIEGHTAGNAHFGSKRKHPTRFERKWLQLRQNALRRGRVVFEAVTPEYIEFVHYPICPVTLVELTHGSAVTTSMKQFKATQVGERADRILAVASRLAFTAAGLKPMPTSPLVRKSSR